MSTPTYSVSVEELCDHAAILRLHDSHEGVFGDPYVWWTVVHAVGDGVALLKGADRKLPDSAAARAVLQALRDLGFAARMHERKGPDGTRIVNKSLPEKRGSECQ